MRVRLKPGMHADAWLDDLYCNFGSGGSSGGSTTTVQKADPWSGQQPYITQQLQEAQRLYGSGGQPQYDTNAYNNALSSWQSTSGPVQTRARAPGSASYNQYGNGTEYLVGGQWVQQAPENGLSSNTPMPQMSDYAIPGSVTNGGLLAPGYYPGKTVADQSPQTQQALGLLTSRATNGSPITDQAKGYLSDVMGGQYLNSNPWLDQTFNKAADQVQGRLTSQFANTGGLGGGLNQDVAAKNYNDLATSIYGGNYDQERNRQQQGLLFGQQLANQDYNDIGQLANAGGAQDAYQQSLINANIDKYNYNSNLPANALRNYVGLTGGNYGGTSTSTQPYSQNNLANGLGGAITGALGGAGLFSAFPETLGALGLGAGGSAGLGGALGLLSMFSDIRLKHDITHVGFEHGFPVYTFKYKADPDHVTYRGVMAQDVMQTRPDAVFMDGDYFKVDYGKIGITMERVH